MGLQKGKYSLILNIAGEIWRCLGNNQKSCEILFGQMRLYKLNMTPYNATYNSSIDTPRIWWLATDDKYDYLQQLALQILGITPHSAGCERIFSTLGWIYDKRRLRLSTTKVEAMAKIRSFYITNINKEVKYTNQNYNAQELKNMIEESMNNMEEEIEDNDNDNESNEDEEEYEQIEIPNQDVFVLIENVFDLNSVPFINNNENIELNTDSETEEEEENNNISEESSKELYDYDVQSLIANYEDSD